MQSKRNIYHIISLYVYKHIKIYKHMNYKFKLILNYITFFRKELSMVCTGWGIYNRRERERERDIYSVEPGAGGFFGIGPPSAPQARATARSNSLLSPPHSSLIHSVRLLPVWLNRYSRYTYIHIFIYIYIHHTRNKVCVCVCERERDLRPV